MNVLSFSWKIFEKSDDNKGVTRSHKSKDRHDNGWPSEKKQDNKQLSAKYYTKN